jgi:RAQPRD family integrative conjugative element protein
MRRVMTRMICGRVGNGVGKGIGIGLICVLLVSPVSVFADADGERGTLARLEHELAALEPLVAEAEAQAPPDARIRFRYDWLREDLERVQAGIRAHVSAARAEPHKIPPLRGDYRR